MAFTFQIDRNRLPKNQDEATEALYQYFQWMEMKDIQFHDDKVCVEVAPYSLQEPRRAYVDSERPLYLAVSHHHCTALIYWEDFFSTIYPDDEKPRLGIVHVDYHDDLMSPRIVFEPSSGKLINLMTEEPFLFNRQGIQRAIDSGAIEVGSFVIPTFYEIPGIDFIWVYPNDKQLLKKRPPQSPLHRYDILGVPGDYLRPESLRLVANPEYKEQATQILGEFNYCCGTLPIIKSWEQITTAEALILNIDLDYFDNRENGDSEWQKNEHWSPPTVEQDRMVEELFIFLQEKELLPRIQLITIAESPNFCPKSSAQRLLEQLMSLIDKTYQTDTTSTILMD